MVQVMRAVAGAAAVALMACGPVWSGKVSGAELTIKDAVFSPLVSRSGEPLGLVVVVGDQSDLCALVSSKSKLPSASVATFVLLGRANGKTLAPELGEYYVGGPTDTGKSSSGSFVRTDANGTLSIPTANTRLGSGVVKVTSLTDTSLVAQLDVRFGQQNDPVTGSFSARVCGALNNVFGTSSSSDPTGPTDPTDPTGGSSGGSGGSCTVNSAGLAYCVTYTGASYSQSTIQTACASSAGTYATSGCSGGGGRCTFGKGTPTEYQWTFLSSGAGTPDPESTCTSGGGTWSPN